MYHKPAGSHRFPSLHPGSDPAFAWSESGKPFRKNHPHFTRLSIRTSISPSSAVELNTTRAAREALHKFKDHRDLEVKLYSTLYHSPVARTLLWGGLTLSAVSCVAALVMFLRRVS
uniref:Uncharacterized protein n=1 Tax=Timema poppense TaxID=170557 RepID=A0A7R9H6A6_TIMPO|nr:unnamed protein product [Timema poppensis]